jgi:hypothetical protein
MFASWHRRKADAYNTYIRKELQELTVHSKLEERGG